MPLEKQIPNTSPGLHMLWVNGSLSQIEVLCLKSFVFHGFCPTLWVYGDVKNVPANVRVEDARHIIPEDRIFQYTNGSYAGFSNLFRYAVLSKLGGLWADCDVVCLRDASDIGSEPFLVSENIRDTHQLKANCNVIYTPHPQRGDCIDLALAIADRYPTEKLVWGDTGPTLLTVLATAYPANCFNIKPPSFANSIPYWDCPWKLLEPGVAVHKEASFLHLYNEMWRQAGIDKNLVFPKGSVLAMLAEKYA